MRAVAIVAAWAVLIVAVVASVADGEWGRLAFSAVATALTIAAWVARRRTQPSR